MGYVLLAGLSGVRARLDALIRITICIAVMATGATTAQPAAQEREHLQPGFSRDWQGLPSSHFDGSKSREYKPLRTLPVRKSNFRNA